MGHAGAIVSGSAGTAQAKKEALEAAGVRVGKTPSETAALMREHHRDFVALARIVRPETRCARPIWREHTAPVAM